MEQPTIIGTVPIRKDLISRVEVLEKQVAALQGFNSAKGTEEIRSKLDFVLLELANIMEWQRNIEESAMNEWDTWNDNEKIDCSLFDIDEDTATTEEYVSGKEESEDMEVDQMNPRKKRKYGGAVPGSDPDNPVIIG